MSVNIIDEDRNVLNVKAIVPEKKTFFAGHSINCNGKVPFLKENQESVIEFIEGDVIYECTRSDPFDLSEHVIPRGVLTDVQPPPVFNKDPIGLNVAQVIVDSSEKCTSDFVHFPEATKVSSGWSINQEEKIDSVAKQSKDLNDLAGDLSKHCNELMQMKSVGSSELEAYRSQRETPTQGKPILGTQVRLGNSYRCKEQDDVVCQTVLFLPDVIAKDSGEPGKVVGSLLDEVIHSLIDLKIVNRLELTNGLLNFVRGQKFPMLTGDSTLQSSVSSPPPPVPNLKLVRGD